MFGQMRRTIKLREVTIMANRLLGKSAVVTGAASGMGKAIALAYLREMCIRDSPYPCFPPDRNCRARGKSTPPAALPRVMTMSRRKASTLQAPAMVK